VYAHALFRKAMLYPKKYKAGLSQSQLENKKPSPRAEEMACKRFAPCTPKIPGLHRDPF